MTARPSFTSLADYVDGRLDSRAAESIEEILATGDPEVEAIIGWLHSFRSVADQLPLETPPVRVRYYLRRQFERQFERRSARGTLTQQLLATLRFDSRRDLTAAGVRSGGLDPGIVHLAFRSDAGDVFLDLAPSDDGHLRVEGQTMWAGGQDAPILEATVTGPGFVESSTGEDELGRFSFARVPADVDLLVLRAPDVDISLTWRPYSTP